MTEQKTQLEIITREHERFGEFVNRLAEKFESCDSSADRPLAKSILKEMGGVDIPATMKYFGSKGGYCDCEILFNVVEHG